MATVVEVKLRLVLSPLEIRPGDDARAAAENVVRTKLPLDEDAGEGILEIVELVA